MMRLVLACLLVFSPAALAKEARLLAPLMQGAENLGDVWVFPSPGRPPELDADSFFKALTSAMDADAYLDLRTKMPPEPRVRADVLEAFGVSVKFDEAALVLRLTLKDELRNRRILKVRQTNMDVRRTQGPETFSGYLNARATQAYTYPQSKARGPFQGDLGFVSNFRGLVLETGAFFTEKQVYEWRRQDTRLTMDFEDQALRITVGDQNLQTTGFQNARAYGGISVSRQYSIQPYLNTRPLNRTEIYLQRPSQIEVWVNSGFVTRLNASPGPVQLSDFPLFSGINKVDLKIIDDTGKVEWVNLNLLYDVQLLGKGIHSFAYALGAPSADFRGDRRYDDRNLTFSFFHRAGLSDRLTMGASFQNDKSSWLAGNDFVFLTRAGVISGEGGLSHLSAGPLGWAGRLRIKSLDYKLGADKPLRGALEAEYKDAHFVSLGQTDNSNEHSWKFTMSLSRPVTAYTSIALSSLYGLNRKGGNDLKQARADVTSELSPNWRGSLNYTIERQNKAVHSIQFTLSWLDSDGKYYGNLSYSYPTKTVRVEASRSPSTIVDDFRATLGSQYSPTQKQADALLEYTHEKALLRLNHVSANEKFVQNVRSTRHVTTFTGATAIAWAGGAFAWSRPITDSFVLLKARPLHRHFKIPVNQQGDSAETVVNRLGPGVVPTLTGYNEAPINLNDIELPLGYSLGRQYYLARPTYKSGLRIDVGGESTVVVTGKLLKPDGKPLELATGEVLDVAKGVAGVYFTNRSGNFLLENLPAGEYQINVNDSEYLPVKFRIEAGQTGLMRLGSITLSKGNTP